MQVANLPEASILKAQWQGLTVEYGRLDAVGEFDFVMPKQAVSVAFMPHECVTWSIDGGPRQTSALPAGTVFLYADRELIWHHRAKASEYLNLVIDPALLKKIAAENGIHEQAGLAHRVMFQDATIIQIAQLLKSELLNGGIAGNLYVESLRNLLAVHLFRNYTPAVVKPTPEVGSLNGFMIKHLRDYIEDHLAQELTVADLAALVPMSQFHFARLFKAVMGESPYRYILQRRLQRAQVLLSNTNLLVGEVAYQTGFSSQSHLIAQFRKAIGLTPTQFRNHG
jgi:AraC family transcriptional regulator